MKVKIERKNKELVGNKNFMINIQENISLVPYTTFRIGGLAKFFCEVKNQEELKEALDFAEKNKVAVFLLGKGSNILFSDDGFAGLVIKLIKGACQISGTNMKCGAGMSLAKVVILAMKTSLTGLEWAAGIPGTIGGAVRGNAGAYGSEMKNIVQAVKVFDIKEKQVRIYNSVECEFEYRCSLFKKNKNLIILSVTLELQKGETEQISQKIQTIVKKRKDTLPKERSAGSFFKNPITNNKKLIKQFEEEKKVKIRDDKIPAAWLIEEAGLRGKKIGGAQVDKKHSNFIVNTGQATAQDVIILASVIKQKVREKLSIQLREEIQYVGF